MLFWFIVTEAKDDRILIIIVIIFYRYIIMFFLLCRFVLTIMKAGYVSGGEHYGIYC